MSVAELDRFKRFHIPGLGSRGEPLFDRVEMTRLLMTAGCTDPPGPTAH